MKRFSLSVSLILIGVLVVPSYAAKPSTRVPPGVRVYDANDQFLGLFLGFADGNCIGARIFVPSLNHSILINLVDYLGQPGAVCINNVRPQYESNDCTGQPYFPQGYEYLDIVGQIDASGVYRYFRVTSSNRKTVTIWSGLEGSMWCYAQPNPLIMYGFDAIEIPKENIPFILPVALPLRYEASGG